MMRIVPSRKYAAFVLTVEGHKPRALFYLILNPPGMQTAVKVLAEYLSFKTDASRADVVSEARALGLGFVAYPVVPGYPISLFRAVATSTGHRRRPEARSAMGQGVSKLIHTQRPSKIPPGPSWQSPGTTG